MQAICSNYDYVIRRALFNYASPPFEQSNAMEPRPL